jgi:hypothetical protein
MGTGYALTFAGVALGSISSSLIMNLVVGGGSTRMERIRTVGDPTKAGTAYPLDNQSRPMVVTIAGKPGAKTVYNTVDAARRAHTKDTFTGTDVEGTTYVGAGYISDVGDLSLGTDAHASFTITIEPETEWAITPGA